MSTLARALKAYEAYEGYEAYEAYEESVRGLVTSRTEEMTCARG
jgi:hypothetical protein